MGEAIAICKLMKTARMKKGMTLKQLSKQTGFSIPALSTWERGVKTPTMFNAECVLRVLGYQLKAVKL